MKNFERKYFFYQDHPSFISDLQKAFDESVISKDNLFYHIDISKSKKYQTITIIVEKNVQINVDVLLDFFNKSTGLKEYTSWQSKQSLNCIFSEKELTDLTYVQMLKELYLNDTDIIEEIPCDEGDDENFISPTLQHYNVEFASTTYFFRVPKSFKND